MQGNCARSRRSRSPRLFEGFFILGVEFSSAQECLCHLKIASAKPSALATAIYRPRNLCYTVQSGTGVGSSLYGAGDQDGNGLVAGLKVACCYSSLGQQAPARGSKEISPVRVHWVFGLLGLSQMGMDMIGMSVRPVLDMNALLIEKCQDFSRFTN